MTQIINFIAGAGAGKSTLAYTLHGWLKTNRYKVAFSPEFATELVWSDRKPEMDDQIFLLGEQHHRIYSLLGKIDYIISDTSLFLNLFYGQTALKKYEEIDPDNNIRSALANLVMHLYYSQDNITFFVNRNNREFMPTGRIHTEEQAKEADGKVKKLLDSYCIEYYNVSSLVEVLQGLKFI